MFIKRVINDKYKPYKVIFKRLMNLLEVMCYKKFKKTYKEILKKINFIQIVSPILLDSDELGGVLMMGIYEDKIKVIRAVF